MTVETLLVMVFGVAALVALRVVLALVGKDFAGDHPHVPLPRRSPELATQKVCRGTGKQKHLVYFPTEEETHAAAVGHHVANEPGRIAKIAS